MAKILVVDDERNVLRAFEEILASKDTRSFRVRGGEDAMGFLQKDDCDLVILDICLPGMNGLDALAQIRQRRPTLPVIVMTGQGTTDTAIEATKRGAFDYQLKPFEPAEMLQTIAKALEGARLMKGHLALGPETAASSAEAIVGRSPAMQQLYKAIGRVAPTDATVLIRGESGTGKELVARAIYQHSLRSDRPLMVVNCAAIPETLLESELFGYEPGAFTGATTRRIGKFEQAHGGTIFLDEIGDMPVMVQAKILRLLQERTFQRLGGNETIQVDVRVLVRHQPRPGTGDRRGRLSRGPLSPPQRGHSAASALARSAGRHPSAGRLLLESLRPRVARRKAAAGPECAGSARPLLLARQRAGVGAPDSAADDLHRRLHDSGPRPAPGASHGGPDHRRRRHASPADEPYLNVIQAYLDSYGGDHACEELLEKIERLLIVEALRRSQGNQTHAGRLLGLPRPTLHAKMQKFGLQGRGDSQDP